MRKLFRYWLSKQGDLDGASVAKIVKTLDIVNNWIKTDFSVSLWDPKPLKASVALALLKEQGQFNEVEFAEIMVRKYTRFADMVSFGELDVDTPIEPDLPTAAEAFFAFRNGDISERDFKKLLLVSKVFVRMEHGLTDKGKALIERYIRAGKTPESLTEKEREKLSAETVCVPATIDVRGNSCLLTFVDSNDDDLVEQDFALLLIYAQKDPSIDLVILDSICVDGSDPVVLTPDDIDQLAAMLERALRQREERVEEREEKEVAPAHEREPRRVVRDNEQDVGLWSRYEDLEPDASQQVGISIPNLRENSVFSFARFQKGVATIRGVRFVNNTNELLTGLKVRVKSSHKLFENFEGVFPLPIHSGKTSKPWKIDLVPTLKALPQGNGSANNNIYHTPIVIEVLKDDKVLGQCSTKVWVLPKYFWEFEYRQDLPVFVLPDDPTVNELRAKTSEFLMKNTGSSSTEGYQSGKKRVQEICKAAYQAVQSWDLDYSDPPARGNGLCGQRVRIPSAVKQTKAGTCMDMTLLYAALLELVGLYPILVLVQGHIFCGVWLDEHEHNGLLRDGSYHGKIEIDRRELQSYCDCYRVLFVECTRMCYDFNNVSFEEAVKYARTSSFKMPFDCAIDVQNARRAGIGALPDQADVNGSVTIVQKTGVDSSKVVERPVRPRKMETELDRWQNALLDLDPENNLLLDLSSGKNELPVVPLFTTHVGEIEDVLAAKQEFSVVAHPNTDVYIGEALKKCVECVQKLAMNEPEKRASGDEVLALAKIPFEIAQIEYGRQLEVALKNDACQDRRLYAIQPLALGALGLLWACVKNFVAMLAATQASNPVMMAQSAQEVVELFGKKGNDDLQEAIKRRDELMKNTLRKLKEFQGSLNKLLEVNKKNVKETGASSLYLAVGVLRWRAADERVSHYAPLILEPIDIDIRGTSQFVIRLRDRDEIRFNGTLIQMMKEKFNIDLAELDPVPQDSSGADVNAVFETIRAKISAFDECRDWDVLEICVIADLKFDKFAIWRDIHAFGNEKLLSNQVVDAMVAGDSRF